MTLYIPIRVIHHAVIHIQTWRRVLKTSYRLFFQYGHFTIFFNRNPNKEPGETRDVDDWPIHTYKEREYIVLDTKFHEHNKKPTVEKGYKIKQCAFWREYVPTLMHTTGMFEVFVRQFCTYVFKPSLPGQLRIHSIYFINN